MRRNKEQGGIGAVLVILNALFSRVKDFQRADNHPDTSGETEKYVIFSEDSWWNSETAQELE